MRDRKMKLKLSEVFGWSLAFFTFVTLISFYIASTWLHQGLFATFRNPIATTITLLFTFGLSCFFFVFLWSQFSGIPIHKERTIKKVVPEVLQKEEELKTEEVVDITAVPPESIFLAPGVKGKKILVEGAESLVYDIQDIRFDFQRLPHALQSGQSGSGKSQLTYNLIELLKKQEPDIRWLVTDFGESDYPIHLGSDTQTGLEVLNHLELIVRGRQKEKKLYYERIIWLLEEGEVWLDGLKVQLSRKEYNEVFVKLANISRMGRKQKIMLWLVTQAGRSQEIDGKVKANFSNLFLMRCNPIISQNVFRVPYILKNLPVGYAYFNAIDAFVKTKVLKPPEMDMMTMRDLRCRANYYRREYGLKEGETD